MNTAINGRVTVLTLGNGDLGRDGRGDAEAISHLEGDCVDASVPAAIAFRSQLYGLAIARYDDVIVGVAISVTIFNFIARDLIDHNAIDVYGTVATAGTSHQVGDVYRVVTVVWWPQFDVISVENYSRRRRVHGQIRALSGRAARAGGFNCVSAGISSLNVGDGQRAGGSGVGNRHSTAEAAGGQDCHTLLPDEAERRGAAGSRCEAGGRTLAHRSIRGIGGCSVRIHGERRALRSAAASAGRCYGHRVIADCHRARRYADARCVTTKERAVDRPGIVERPSAARCGREVCRRALANCLVRRIRSGSVGINRKRRAL